MTVEIRVETGCAADTMAGVKQVAKRLAIMGISLTGREDISPKVQGVLSDFGDEILMRAGIPSPDRTKGLITLTLQSEEQTMQQLATRLQEIEGVVVRTIAF